jgi:hypothetical protein
LPRGRRRDWRRAVLESETGAGSRPALLLASSSKPQIGLEVLKLSILVHLAVGLGLARKEMRSRT